MAEEEETREEVIPPPWSANPLVPARSSRPVAVCSAQGERPSFHAHLVRSGGHMLGVRASWWLTCRDEQKQMLRRRRRGGSSTCNTRQHCGRQRKLPTARAPQLQRTGRPDRAPNAFAGAQTPGQTSCDRQELHPAPSYRRANMATADPTTIEANSRLPLEHGRGGVIFEFPQPSSGHSSPGNMKTYEMQPSHQFLGALCTAALVHKIRPL